MINQKALWDKLAKENSKYYINSDNGKKITEKEFWESGHRDYIKHILNDDLISGKIITGLTILDVGCGIGRMTEFMANNFNTVIGVDISGEMIEQGKKRLEDKHNVELLETDGNTFPYIRNDSVDIAFSYLVFQHIKSRESVESNFREVFRVLKKGGLFKVLLRTNKNDSMEKWWSGVYYDFDSASLLYTNIGFTMIKASLVGDYAMWLWLEK